VLTALVAFTAVAIVLTITPGLDTMLVLRTAIGSGARVGLLAGLGVALGCYLWGVATAAGLTALLAASELAFTILRIAGAAYLVWLGGRALWNARKRKAAATPEAKDGEQQPPQGAGAGAGVGAGVGIGALAAIRNGFLTNLLNPKIGVFYMTLLPQFVPPGRSVFWTTLALVTIHNVLGMLWFTLLTSAARTMRHRLTRPNVKRRIEQLTGVAFLGFGVQLATQAK
jgi:threonine/homoserine/homoserine lactone efflux protein